MDRLLVMRSFVTVAKVGSFSGAAKALGTSGSLISRHVADLEKQVGVRLVNRTARSINLTEPGLRYSDFAERILDEVDHEDITIAQLRDKPAGALSIICPKWIGSYDLGDAIAAFAVAYPLIQIKFELGGMSDRTYDFIERGFDIAFHTRDLRDSSVRLRKIASLPFVLCASPDYVERHGTLRHPNDLADYDCLVHVNDPVWRIGQGQGSTLHKIRNIAFSSNSYIALQKAAMHGRGIALLPQRSAYDDLVAGDLVALLPDIPVADRSLYAIYAPERATPRKTQVFLEFLVAWFAENPIAELSSQTEHRNQTIRTERQQP